ncbi:NAD-glutamate dehydrogenase [Neptunomonas marina]|uniref:NAD-glutamate dehydrogenase n=1 Tax=Neptunomonas marina TaxID=1815562 RepID=A0A437QBD9_9GAMM|nr:NAD-glutamate dehydrogenase [Neptunomonas marina]RVU31709.1 NAD-glutamate dehydrogenase [Neptunomonas marina]
MDSEIAGKNKNKVLSKLRDTFKRRLGEEQAAGVSGFADLLLSLAPEDEIAQRPVEALYGATLSTWTFIQQFACQQSKIQVFNPDLEQHGWHSNHTVIQILSVDSPFIVDSVRMELNRQGIGIHVIHNVVIKAERDGENLTSLQSEAGSPESIVYLEVDRHTEADLLKRLHGELTAAMNAVSVSVRDFPAMKTRAGACADYLNEIGHPEYSSFVTWLMDDHFTFLASDEVTFADGEVTVVGESELGQLTASGLINLTEFTPVCDALTITRHNERSRVHRLAYLNLIVVGRFNDAGECVGATRFLGLYTSPVYTERPQRIPLIRSKVERVLARSGFDRHGHAGKSLTQVLNDLPRDELLLATDDELYGMAMKVFYLQERRRACLVVREDKSGQFYTCLYYVPRDLFTTALRLNVQHLLGDVFNAEDIEFTNWFSESVMARTHFVVRVKPGQEAPDLEQVEADVQELSRSWNDDLSAALIEGYGEELGTIRGNHYREAFPAAYREHFTALHAVHDIGKMEALADSPLTMSFYRLLEQSQTVLRFKLFTAEVPLVLSDVIPVLENLGLRVVGEHPYTIRRTDGSVFWIHDFSLSHAGAGDEPLDLDEVKEIFQQAFAKIWSNEADNDEFNRLVLSAGLSWREVVMLRAYARYNQQLRFGFSQAYIAETLARHVQVTRLLVALFRARFEPGRQGRTKLQAVMDRIESSILDALDKVDNLNEDKIIRRYLELMKATLRTNFFQVNSAGEPKSYVSFKLNPHAIAEIPRPRPMFEIFVYSSRIEGVHLRGGKVARGGLRWSDRLEDYRTEVLGLVKAQQVKNAVIVPVGAKGGFVAKCLPTEGGRDAFMAEGIASYKTFIRGLLDLADNLQGGEVVPPENVVRHDEDDPYMVVAADKGTATFSDIANEIADEYGFWLGDAFASGGSQGYDHKGMGITARGAWESVKLHFREMGINTQADPFTVVGVGDMAGDVFGNGMLLSDKIRLVAAFNHMHIFIDPTPDEAKSFVERQRMFELPRSTWEDYDKSLISAGGGVFSRAAKSIDITPEMKKAFDIKADKLSPNELITALLKAPVDLFWNGGIGTYVKASHESHADVGDKATDALRINGSELRCKVVGEGGNLGLTQLGRIEYSQHGGKCNTDFIDNAGGVDCSDHEVNIKILLNERVAEGDLTVKQRNVLLRDMTDTVAEQVLKSNDRQARALSLAHEHAKKSQDEYVRLMNRLEDEGRLDRALEFLPEDDALQERLQRGQSLTRPELSVLISYTKAELKEVLTHAWITDDPYVRKEIAEAFPEQLVERFPAAVEDHQLKREIIATQVANAMVNHMGITFTNRMMETAGQSADQVAVAYLVARDVFQLREIWAEIEALDNIVPAEQQNRMLVDLLRLMRRASYWFLRNVCSRGCFSVQEVIDRFKPAVTQIRESISDLLTGEIKTAWLGQQQSLIDEGIPAELASRIACAERLYAALAISEVAMEQEESLIQTAEVFFVLGERLQLDWVSEQIRAIEPENHWQLLAREGFNEDLNNQQQALTRSVLASQSEQSGLARAEEWLGQKEAGLKRWESMLTELRSATASDSATFTVVMRELNELSKSL